MRNINPLALALVVVSATLIVVSIALLTNS